MGRRNKSYGDLSLNSVNGMQISHGVTETDNAIDTYVKDFVAVAGANTANGIFARTAIGTVIENVTVYGGSSTGVLADNRYDSRRSPNDACNGPCPHVHSPSIAMSNVLARGTTGSTVAVNNSGEFSSIVIEYSHGWLTAGWGSGTTGRTNSPPSPPGNVDPALGSCRVFIPAASPMFGVGKGGANIGASILYATEGGKLTTKKIWDSSTGQWSATLRGAVIAGVNDTNALSTLGTRLHAGCSWPGGY